MISNLKLYGTNDVPRVPKFVANTRLRLLNERLGNLMKVGFMQRDNHTINKILEAQKHWTRLRDGENI